MSDPRNASYIDSSYNNNPMNSSTPTPQYSFPSMFQTPFFPVSSGMQFNPINMQGFPNQQNFPSQSMQQPEARQEIPKSNPNSSPDIEAMQNMMRMLNLKMNNQYQPQTNVFQSSNNQFQSPVSQMQSPVGQMQSPSNPSDFMNFANSMMMAQQMMSQMNSSQPKFDLPAPSLASSVGELFNKNVSSLQNFYSMIANTNPNLIDQKVKGSQLVDPRNTSKTSEFQKGQDPFANPTEFLDKQTKFDTRYGDKYGNKFLEQEQSIPQKKANQPLNEFESANYRDFEIPESAGQRNPRRTKQYSDVTIEEDYPRHGITPGEPLRGTLHSQATKAIKRDNNSFEEQDVRKKGGADNFEYVPEADERPIKSSGAYNFVEFDKKQSANQGASNERNREEVSRAKNPFDEVPIGGKAGKRFEDILEEQLRKSPGGNRDNNIKASKMKEDSSEPKNFLKKKSRPFLSSAANRPNKPTHQGSKGTEMQGISSPNNAGNSQPSSFPSKNARGDGKQTEKSQGQSQSKFYDGYENEDYAKFSDNKTHPKPPRRFLAKGGGTGGGKGMNSSQESFSKAGQRAESEENTRNNFYDDREERYPRKDEPVLEKSQSQERFGKAGTQTKNRDNSRRARDESPSSTDRIRVTDDTNDFIIKEKIETLNSEIAKFKLENERVKKIRQRHEDMLKNLNKEIEEFELKKMQFEREVEQSREDEIRKAKKERKTVDKKKEKDEPEFFKQQLADALADFNTKEQKYKVIIDRLKKQVEDLTFQNNELLQELKTRGLGTNQPDSKVAVVSSKPTASIGKDHSMGYILEEDEENQEDEDDDPNSQNKFRITSGDSGSKNPAAGQKNAEKAGPGAIKNFQSPHNDRNSAKNHSDEGAQAKLRLLKRRIQENEFKFEENPFYKRYLENRNTTSKLVSQTSSNDGKLQRVFEDGKKEVIFQNGVNREIFPEGYTIVHFMNKDIKQTLPDGTVIYFFAEANTTQTTLTTGTNIFRFANNQVEFHNADNTREIHFADGTKKLINSNGEETTIFTDGTVQRVGSDKIKHIEFANGQKDTVFVDGSKIRTYPDGRVKKYNTSGKMEE